MSILTRQERERHVLDLYNQGKTIREIAKEVRMSFRDIGAILNKTVEEKTEGIKQNNNNGGEKNQEHLSLSSQAYKLFSEGKTPLQVAIKLNLRESEATKFYKEYWKLKQLYNLNMIYEELKGDIEPFLKLYKLAKRKGMGIKQVVDILATASNDLPAIEKRFNRLRNDISMLQFQKRIDERNLSQLNNQVASTTKLLTSYRISSIRERREIENLYNEKVRITNLVTHFKNNNKEYLKIKQVAEDKVKDILTDSKLLLKFATLSVIESLRNNPELYNFVIHDNSNNTCVCYGSNYPSLMLSGRQQHQQQQSFNDSYTALILEEAEKLYSELTTKLTNSVITS
jgi:predicted transcriptional regulator